MNQAEAPDDAWTGIPDATDPVAREAALREAVTRVVAERGTAVAADQWRQGFHIQPPVGLLNDPNGLVQHDGVYHLCYQWHPAEPKHGLKLWAYLTSTDMVHWEEHPPALVPSEQYESHGCYSGSGIVHDSAVHFLYTGNVRTADGGRIANQVLARLEADGSVRKVQGNPVIGPLSDYSEHVRDPKVWHEDGAYWMVLGAQTTDLHGTALLLRSTDLREWELQGSLGGGASDPVNGYMWECPDVLRFPEGDVLVISAQEELGTDAQPQRVDHTDYAVGRLSLDPAGFERSTPFRRMDAGPDFYAPQTFRAEDGRLLLIGWLGMPDQPGQPSLATKHPSVRNGWVHCLSVPREVSLVEGTLAQQPVAELAALRGESTQAAFLVDPGVGVHVAGVSGTRIELALTVRAGEGARLVLSLRARDHSPVDPVEHALVEPVETNPPHPEQTLAEPVETNPAHPEQTLVEPVETNTPHPASPAEQADLDRPVRLVVDPAAGSITLDRTALGTGEGGRWTGRIRSAETVDVRVLMDSSSIEVFADEGRCVLSARIYPTADEAITWAAEGGPVAVEVEAWPFGAAEQSAD